MGEGGARRVAPSRDAAGRESPSRAARTFEPPATATRKPQPTTRGPRLAPRAPLTVRPATVDDLQMVVTLRLALLREHSTNAVYGRLRQDAPARAEKLFAAQLASPTEVTFLALRNAECVGILRCVDSVGSPLLYPAHFGYVSSVYVVPGARRSGVLRALLADAERWCAARGLTELRLHNAADSRLSNSVWDALGFEVVEQLRVRPLPRG